MKSFEEVTELRWRVSKISDEYLPPEFIRPKDERNIAVDTVLPTGAYTVESEVETETYKRYSITGRGDMVVPVLQAHFPGWTYWVNGREVKPAIIDGLPNIPVPAGVSVVELKFLSTPVRTIGNIISFLTLAAVVYTYGKRQTKKTIT